ncbi:MAG: ORF6N domain-containing protein [Sphingobacteriales bacterium]|nr:ORF6N domain-containing protein [Sphingobacteriales bacterium]
MEIIQSVQTRIHEIRGQRIMLDFDLASLYEVETKVLNPLRQTDLKEQLQEIKQRLGEHYTQLNSIYDAMENLLDEKAVHRKWDDRERIGFNK